MSTDPYADAELEKFHMQAEGARSLKQAVQGIRQEITRAQNAATRLMLDMGISTEETAEAMADALRRNEPALSTPEDIDSRTGERRLLVDDYRLHADHVDTVRVALEAIFPSALGRLGRSEWLQDQAMTEVAVAELWAIERACRALGIED